MTHQNFLHCFTAAIHLFLSGIPVKIGPMPKILQILILDILQDGNGIVMLEMIEVLELAVHFPDPPL